MRTLTDEKKIARDAAQPGVAPGGDFQVRLAGRGALRALGLDGEGEAGSGREGKVLAVFRRSFYVAFGDEEENALACFVPESIGAGSLAGPLNVICDLPPGIDWEASGLRPGEGAWVSGGRPGPGRTHPGRVDAGRLTVGRFSFSFGDVETWRPQAVLSGADLPEKLRRADVIRRLAEMAALAAEMAPAEGLGRLIPEMAGLAGGGKSAGDMSVARTVVGAENTGDMSGPRGAMRAYRRAGYHPDGCHPAGADSVEVDPVGADPVGANPAGCQAGNAAKRQVIRAGRRGAWALVDWMCDMLHSTSPGLSQDPGPSQGGAPSQGPQIEISSPGPRAAGLVGLGPGLTPSGDDFIGGAMVALRALGRGVLADGLAGWALPLAAEGTSRISRAHLAEAARGAGAGALHGMLEALCRPAGVGILSRLHAIDAVGHTSGWDALAGAAAALGAVFRVDIGAESRPGDKS